MWASRLAAVGAIYTLCPRSNRWECFCLAVPSVYQERLDEIDIDFPGTSTKAMISASVSEHENRESLSPLGRIRGEYSEKVLTNPADRFSDFSGIARRVHKVLGSAPADYRAGLWKPKLLRDLLWV